MNIEKIKEFIQYGMTLKDDVTIKRIKDIKIMVAEWSELLNIPYTTIRRRQNLGWNEYDTLTKPIKGGGCGDK